MTAQIIDGAQIAEEIRTQIARDAATFQAAHGLPPGLGVVLVGDDPASAQYVRMKRRACAQVGIESFAHVLPADATQAQVESAVRALNDDPRVHGILVQLPMPAQIDEEAVLRLIDLPKDADGQHPLNLAAIGMKGRDPLFTPATPTGVMVILERIGVELSGANAVVVGRSNIVGLPMALLLLRANATVTVVHSRTRDMPDILRRADVVVAALGKPQFIKGDWLKAGAVVIDVGTNRIDDPTTERGYRFVGDVDLESAREVVSAITQVPGGVGPLTITMLLANTVRAAQRIAERGA